MMKVYQIRELDPAHIDKLITLKGIVIRTSDTYNACAKNLDLLKEVVLPNQIIVKNVRNLELLKLFTTSASLQINSMLNYKRHQRQYLRVKLLKQFNFKHLKWM